MDIWVTRGVSPPPEKRACTLCTAAATSTAQPKAAAGPGAVAHKTPGVVAVDADAVGEEDRYVYFDVGSLLPLRLARTPTSYKALRFGGSQPTRTRSLDRTLSPSTSLEDLPAFRLSEGSGAPGSQAL